MKRICCLTGAIILLVSASSCRQATDVSQDAVAATPEDAPQAVDALALLNASLETSEATGKRVLVHLSSPGCAPCRLLELMFHENATLFEKDFVVLGIDQATMVNGQVVMEMVGSTGSTPWVSILDSNGNVIADSVGPNGNVGYPSRKAEIDHFTGMIGGSMIEPDASTLEKIGSLFRSLPDATTTPISEDNETALKERNTNACAIAATAVQSYYQRTGKWPLGWDELETELVGVFDRIRDARSKIRDLSDPFARGLDFTSEESQSILSRLPELPGLGPENIRDHVDINFAFDPDSVYEKTNWQNFQGIKPHEPAFNFHRVEFTKLISRLASGDTTPASRQNEAK